MKVRFFNLIASYVLIAMCCACAGNSEESEQKDIYAKTDSIPNKHAVNFSVQKQGDLTILSIGEAWRGSQERFRYVLYPKGQTAPKGFGNAVLIPIPVERAICTGTSHAAMLDFLGLNDRLVAIADGKYLYNERLRQRIDSGTLPELGNDNGINYEKALAVNPELVFSFNFGRGQSYRKFQELGLPVVMLSEFMEDTPLGRAEWLRFIAYFFKKEKEADSAFAVLEKNYLTLSAKVAENTINKHKPKVLLNIAQEGSWYVAGGKSFMARFIADAGGEYLWADNTDRGGLPLDFEAVLHKGQAADVWLNVVLADSRAALKALDSRYTAFDAFSKGNIYSYTARVSENGGYDFYESANVRPDLVLADLIHIFYPQVLPEHQLYYYKKVD